MTHKGLDPAAWGVATSYKDYRGETITPPRETVQRVMELMEAVGDPPAVRTERAIGAPPSCYLPSAMPTWGWAAQLYSMRSSRSWGIGDLGDLATFGRWAAGLGAGVVQLNPLHATLPGEPQQPSPYFPSSRCFLDPLYLCIDDVPRARESVMELDALAREGRALSDGDRIDRDAVYRVKMRALELLWEHRPESSGFDSFVHSRGSLLRDHATFVTLVESLGRDRSTWPPGYEHPGTPAVARWRDANSERISFHCWLQWKLDEQLSRAAEEIPLIHDLAVGVDPAGADAWSWQGVLAEGASVGAPPDEFNRDGQVWGVQPFDPWKLQASGYEPFVQTLRAGLRHAAGLRIDHVMGLWRLFWVPDGLDPAEGTYVSYPHDDLLGIVARESARAAAYIVGEDLGTVEERVRDEMTARGMLSYRIMWFEEEPPKSYPRQALAAVTNHDLPTIAGLWTGRDLEVQQELGLDPNVEATEAIRRRLRDRLGLDDASPIEDVIAKSYALLGDAPSAILIATLEDAFAVEERPNQPGTSDERPNWSLPLPARLEDFGRHELPTRIARALTRE